METCSVQTHPCLTRKQRRAVRNARLCFLIEAGVPLICFNPRCV
jgi:hypothetical protein